MFYLDTERFDWFKDEYNRYQGYKSAENIALVQLRHYRALYQNNHNWGAIWQLAVIFGSGLATVFALQKNLDPVVRAAPALVATVASNIMAYFNFRAEALRQGATAVSIEREYSLYCAGARPYNTGDQNAKGRLLATNVRSAIEGDVNLWRTRGQGESERQHGLAQTADTVETASSEAVSGPASGKAGRRVRLWRRLK